MTFSKTNIEALTELMAASGHGPMVYYLPERPEVLAERLIQAARGDGSHLVLAPDENPAALALVRLLDWDTRFFGFPCALIDTILARGDNAQRFASAREAAGRCLNWCRRKEVRFVSVKLPGPDPAVIQALENLGFYMTNLNLGLTWTEREAPDRPLPPGFGFTTELRDPKSIARTFRQLFYDGRFHNDPHISMDTADRLWEAAILNQLNAEASELLFLEKEAPAGRVRTVGLATVKPLNIGRNDMGRKAGSLFVFGILPEDRGLGLGKALLSGLLSRIKERYGRIEVETSSFNLPAVRMYQQCGFTVGGAKIALHWWKD